MTIPTVKMPTARTMDHRLPRMSVVGVAKRALKKVPADKMETTRDRWDGVMLHTPAVGLTVSKVHNQFLMAWALEITPVS